jgi:hypothetical protein
MEDQKPAWQSKTLWCSVIVAAAPMFPPVAQAVIGNPVLCSFFVGSVFAVLRFVTDKAVTVKK